MKLDIVVPSAHPPEIVGRTLPALLRGVEAADLDPSTVTIVDERPDREGFPQLVERLGFARIATGGVGNGAARNRGAASGAAPWLLFLDDDVELDPVALTEVERILPGARSSDIVIGGMRAPDGAAPWLSWTYEATTVNPAAAAAGAAELPLTGLAVTLLLVSRELFERVNGFPELDSWGWIDASFGLRLMNLHDPTIRVVRNPAISGVHHYVPTWEQWLARMERAGARLAEIVAGSSAGDAEALLAAAGFGRTLRGRTKRLLRHWPVGRAAPPGNRLLARLAAAAAMARGLATGPGE